MDSLIEALRRDAGSFARDLAAECQARGLVVTQPDGSARPILTTATPMVVASSELDRRAHLAALLASAGTKMARALLSGSHRDALLEALSPLERELAEKTWSKVERLVTTRVDYFISQGRAFALELNATIPAMQAYSDIAAEAFLDVVGRTWNIPRQRIEELKAGVPSNSRALYRALLSGYASERRGQTPERIALLCRRNDPQISELRHLRERFCRWGTPTEVVFPDELAGEQKLEARGQTIDLLYRHLFVRRLEDPTLKGRDYVRRLFAEVPGRRAVVLNPPVSQVEVKSTFAFLSQAVGDAQLAQAAGLDADELRAISEAVPWTRPFRPVAALDPDGSATGNLVERVAEEPERFVLKRAWDYGGRAVFVGRASRDPSFAERAKATFGAALTWPELCRQAALDRAGGGFVVQELVPPVAQPHVLCTPDGPLPAHLYVDFSSFASVGVGEDPGWGAVCRGSSSEIVNIVGGGGVLPLLTEKVAEALFAARPPPGARNGRAERP